MTSLSSSDARADGNTLVLAKGSRLWLEGDSTLHKYKSEATQFHASFTVNEVTPAEATVAGTLESLLRGGAMKGLVFTVPVNKLSSGESGLDENMVKALKGAANPTITFRMDSYQVVPASTAGASFTLKLTGRLSIAGVEKKTDLEVQAAPSSTGLRLTGSKDLLMSDFGVQPPVLMMGMIKTKDLVTIRFDLQLAHS